MLLSLLVPPPVSYPPLPLMDGRALSSGAEQLNVQRLQDAFQTMASVPGLSSGSSASRPLTHGIHAAGLAASAASSFNPQEPLSLEDYMRDDPGFSECLLHLF